MRSPTSTSSKAAVAVIVWTPGISFPLPSRSSVNTRRYASPVHFVAILHGREEFSAGILGAEGAGLSSSQLDHDVFLPSAVIAGIE